MRKGSGKSRPGKEEEAWFGGRVEEEMEEQRAKIREEDRIWESELMKRKRERAMEQMWGPQYGRSGGTR